MVVVDLATEALDVARLSLAAADGGELSRWEPGAHVDLILEEGLERQYSLCGDPKDRSCWKVAVLRERDGRGGSEFVHTRLQPGAELTVRGPRNHFPLVDSPEYRLVAGGIGITPLMPMVVRLAQTDADWRLLYGGRRRASMAFVDRLLELGGDRVEIRPEDEHGLLDLDGFLGEPRATAAIYCCGPEPLLRAVEDRCGRWPADALHAGRFQAKPGALEGPVDAFDVELARSGITLHVPGDQAIVDVLEAAGVDVETSCREGICGTCETRVLAGVPDHRDSYLTDAEREGGEVMMICCSRALSRRLVLDR